MPLINIVVALIVVGVALWLINNFIPMAASIKTILKYRGGSLGCRVGPASGRTVGARHQL